MEQPPDTLGIGEPWVLRHAALLVCIGSTLTVGVGVLSLLLLPRLGLLTGHLTGAALQSERADVRRTGLAIATGLGAVTAGALAWGRLELSRLEHLQRRREFDLEGVRRDRENRNERFARAIELLGNAELNVRLGGLYALEGLAQDDRSMAHTVYDVVGAFARATAPASGIPPSDSHRSFPDVPSDYAAALAIILRRPDPAGTPVDLRGVYVPPVHAERLENVNLVGARIVGCRFAATSNCNFAMAQLQDCDFTRAHLTECNFERSTVTGSRFSGATIEHASFRGAVIENCIFSDAVVKDGAALDDCMFDDARIRRCNFRSTRFTDCSFGSARLVATAIVVGWARISRTDFAGAAFERCSFWGVKYDKKTTLLPHQIDLSTAKQVDDPETDEASEAADRESDMKED